MYNNILENYMDVDITDKMALEEQINYVRNEYFNSIKAWEKATNEISQLKGDLSRRATEYYADISIKNAEINRRLKADEGYMEISYTIEALERGEKILSEKIAFLKSDLRILTNTMYHKF